MLKLVGLLSPVSRSFSSSVPTRVFPRCFSQTSRILVLDDSTPFTPPPSFLPNAPPSAGLSTPNAPRAVRRKMKQQSLREINAEITRARDSKGILRIVTSIEGPPEPVNISTALSRLAKQCKTDQRRQQLLNSPDFDTLKHMLLSCIDRMPFRYAAHSAHSLMLLGCEDREVYERLATRATDVLDNMTAQFLIELLTVLEKKNIAHPPLFRSLARYLANPNHTAILMKFSARHLVLILRSYATLGYGEDTFDDAEMRHFARLLVTVTRQRLYSLTKLPKRELKAALAAQSEEDQISAHDLCSLLYCSVRLRVNDPQVFPVVTTAMLSLLSMPYRVETKERTHPGPQDYVDFFFACSSRSLSHPELFEQLSQLVLAMVDKKPFKHFSESQLLRLTQSCLALGFDQGLESVSEASSSSPATHRLLSKLLALLHRPHFGSALTAEESEMLNDIRASIEEVEVEEEVDEESVETEEGLVAEEEEGVMSEDVETEELEHERVDGYEMAPLIQGQAKPKGRMIEDEDVSDSDFDSELDVSDEELSDAGWHMPPADFATSKTVIPDPSAFELPLSPPDSSSSSPSASTRPSKPPKGIKVNIRPKSPQIL